MSLVEIVCSNDFFFFFQAEDGIRDRDVTGVQTCALPISPRPFTPARKLGDDVPEDEKSARLEELFALTEEQRRAHLAGLVGSTQQVLVEGRGRTRALTGRSERHEIVHFAGPEALVGRIVPVVVREAFKNSLGGQLPAALAADFAAPAPGGAPPTPPRARRP